MDYQAQGTAVYEVRHETRVGKSLCEAKREQGKTMTPQLKDDIQALRSTGHLAIAAQYKRMAEALKMIKLWSKDKDACRLAAKVTERFGEK